MNSPWGFFALHLVLTFAVGAHALFHKTDPRSVWGWVAFCWLVPVVGAVLYSVFGINRFNAEVGAVRAWNQTRGNRITPLADGEEAYPAMLSAISGARKSVYLASYIFQADHIGRDFASALSLAIVRGVEVRVLLDGFADLAYRPRASTLLQSLRIPYATVPIFRGPSMLPHLNLRNHRKMLIVDGHIAFTGGMNIASFHLVQETRSRPVSDLHFELRGPVVGDLARVFRDNWMRFSGEPVDLRPRPLACEGQASARIIPDGPDDRSDAVLLSMLSAIGAARTRVRIMTPYFLPPLPIVATLQAAALRGVSIQVLIPAHSNHPWIDWATRRAVTPLMNHGVQIFLGRAPFTHTKMLLIDDDYLQIGSANLDVRSLRLNFELNIEIQDPETHATLSGYFEQRQKAAAHLAVSDICTRGVLARWRDAVSWMLSPYL